MLSPERIERVGRAEGEIAAELQEALLRLVMANVRAALERGGMGVDALFRLSLDVQQQALREIARRNPEMVAEAARDVAEALAESMDDDLSRIGTTLGELPPHVAADMHRGAATTAQGVAEIVRRDNLSMADDARRQFLNTTSTHVSLVNAGQLTFEEAVRAACAELAASGVRCVDYASGQRADLDVAIRRHVRSQINQAGNRRTMQLMEECGVGFVEVSSHVGARPSHRAWQGRCYSLNGRQVVDGEVYEDFWEATGYQGRNGAKLGDQLCGVNCRHSFGPYLPGEPRAYSPTPDEDAGLDPDEAYAATQRQRELERRVRRAKREAEAAEAAGDDASAERAAVRKAQRDVREHVASHSHLGRQYGQERSNVFARARGASINRFRSNTSPDSKISSGAHYSSGSEPEEMWFHANGEEVWHDIGDVYGVDIPAPSELGGHLYSGLDVTHTHTTSVGGTFGSDDIHALTGLNFRSSTVRETQGRQRAFKLTRTLAATRRRRAEFANRFISFERETFDRLLDDYYEKYRKPYGQGITNYDYREIDRQLKEELDAWLDVNAGKYGYNYDKW